jgi:hypothetical protein
MARARGRAAGGLAAVALVTGVFAAARAGGAPDPVVAVPHVLRHDVFVAYARLRRAGLRVSLPRGVAIAYLAGPPYVLPWGDRCGVFTPTPLEVWGRQK